MSEPLFPLSIERARELVVKYGMLNNEPRQERKPCGGVCCQGKKPRGHGPYWFIGHAYVGSDEKLASVLAELRVARRMVAQERDEALAARFDLITHPQKSSSVGDGRRSSRGIDRARGRQPKAS